MTASKLSLLQKLLSDREQLVILHQNSFICSCGSVFEDLNDVENHLVQKHEKISKENARKSVEDMLQDTIQNLSRKTLDYPRSDMSNYLPKSSY